MQTKTQLTLAVIAALGLTASSAFASTDSSLAGWTSLQAAEVSKSFVLLAKQGRGKEGDKAEDNGVDAPGAPDDNGVDPDCINAEGEDVPCE